jgi:hypothetical protein
MLTLVNEKWSNLTRQRPKLFLGLLIALMLMSSAFMPAQQRANTSVYESDVAVAWFDLSLKLVQETAGFTPPVASRAFGYLGVTLYETVQPGMPGYQSLVGQLNELERLPKANLQANFHWPSAANAALASSLRKFFPTATPANLAAIEEMEARFAQPTNDRWCGGEVLPMLSLLGRPLTEGMKDIAATSSIATFRPPVQVFGSVHHLAMQRLSNPTGVTTDLLSWPQVILALHPRPISIPRIQIHVSTSKL